MTATKNVGGQAILEGVMMRGPEAMVMAVRRPDGRIVVKDSTWIPLVKRIPVLRWPFLRGAAVMVEAMINGMQALSYSADVAAAGEEAAKRKAEAESEAESESEAEAEPVCRTTESESESEPESEPGPGAWEASRRRGATGSSWPRRPRPGRRGPS